MDEERKEVVERVNNTGETIQETKRVEELKKDKKGYSIASMVLGIISLALFCVFYISIPCAILAIIFGVLSSKSTGKGMAIAGITTGVIGLSINVLIFGVAIFSNAQYYL